MVGREKTVSDSEILLVFKESKDPVLSAPEVSKDISIGKTGTYQRLRELESKGWLDSKKIGQGRAWWITEKGKQHLKNDPQ